MLPVPTLDELSAFSGRPEATYGMFASMALEQATLMLSLVTRLTDYPDDPDLAKLARFAILELADRLFLEQPYAEYVAKPFQAETIMSYSYSRATPTASKVQQGIKTGLFWWDLAVDELSQPGNSVLAHGSVGPIPAGLVLDGQTGQYVIRNAAEDDENGGMPYVRIS